MSATPTFAGRRAVVLHRPGDTTLHLSRQLGLLGLEAQTRWAPLAPDDPADVVFVDADEGWSGLLPWQGGESPVPLVALLGSEAPGRIAWALDRGAHALVAKPVTSSAVYPALVMAFRRHAEMRDAARRIAELQERVRLRPLVLGAVQALMRARGCGEEEAYRHLRRDAMGARVPLEQAAAAILAAPRTRAG